MYNDRSEGCRGRKTRSRKSDKGRGRVVDYLSLPVTEKCFTYPPSHRHPPQGPEALSLTERAGGTRE